MAYARVLEGPRRALAILAAVLILVATTNTTAYATPSVADLEAQINQEWNTLEPLVEQYNMVHAQLQPGDLVFYFSDHHHMSMYVGGNWVVHAPTSGDVVRMTTLDNPYLPIAGFRRPG